MRTPFAGPRTRSHEPLERRSASARTSATLASGIQSAAAPARSLTSPCPIDAIRVLRVVEAERFRGGVEQRVVRLGDGGAASARARESPGRASPTCSAPRCGATGGSCVARAPCARAPASRGSASRVGDVMISTVSEFLQLARERRDAAVDLRALAVRPRPRCARRTRSRSASRPSGSSITSPVGVKTKISSW